ncbi:MAG: pyruvate kinase [Rikenellaceae bacterium]
MQKKTGGVYGAPITYNQDTEMTNFPKKQTKIVATISDLNCDVDFLKALYEEGMNVVRINSAHSTFEGAQKIVDNVRAVSEGIAILIDTKGPEVRITKITEGFVELQEGETINIKGCEDNLCEGSSSECIFVNDYTFYDDVPAGAKVLVDDGEIELIVSEKLEDSKTLVCKALNSGTLKSNKSVNIPGIAIDLPSLTERDKEYIEWAMTAGIDFIAHSFVRTKEDLIDIQTILDKEGSNIKLIAKIENQQGVDNIDEILDHCYGIMVARGDLGVELPAEQIPITQRALVKKCIESKKPVIIATQMLHSMISSPRPTRAEVSDIAGAIYQRVDAIMLSGETAMGSYPIEAVRTMASIASSIEREVEPIIDINMVRINNEITAQLSRSAVRASTNLPIRAIISDTLSGRTARYLAAFRGAKPVFTLCYRKHVMRELALSYGVYAEYGEPLIAHDRFTFNMLVDLEKTGVLQPTDMVIVVGGSFGASRGASFMEISKVIHLINKALLEE